ncbi:MAG: ATP-binding protein [Delftia acidovorans]|nr:ATP-binding protein [Delftia acidovorans]
MDTQQAEPVVIETVGQFSEKINVELSTRFLEHFSEQLYSSPQKAFEELISNSWDAGADFVDIRISEDLTSPNATMCVLDNGVSMDESGLKDLWHIAFSAKRDKPLQNGRHVVGKFGIGKLATYVLASKLTYVCKAADGKIRRVTMDYSDIDRQKGAKPDKLISELELDIFEVSEQDIGSALAGVYGGDVILKAIQDGVKSDESTVEANREFGGSAAILARPTSPTWTLVVLSGLKPVGKELKLHVLRRMLQAALPFGSEMVIKVNSERLLSSKILTPVAKEWIIGPDLGFNFIEIDKEVDDDEPSLKPASSSKVATSNAGALANNKEPAKELIEITVGTSPYPYIEIPGIGKVTGTVRIFEEKISGGKSDDRGASNGFQINVLGRVVNQTDPSFGEENLSHAAWARFRMGARADGLNELLTTNREQFKERRETKIFRAFLRKSFNVARNYFDSDMNLSMPDGGDVLVKSLGVLSLNPLRSVVSETLKTQAPLPDLFDETGVLDREAKRLEWRAETADNIKTALAKVTYEKSDDDSFVKFRIKDNTIVVNKDHPFVVENSRSKAEKELVRTVAMVNLLTDVFSLDIGIDPALMREVRAYRDQLMRFKALQRRQSGTYIAKLLLQTQHESDHSKRMEAVVSDALRYLGFQVRDLAKPGEPEGIASAYPMPTQADPTKDDPNPPLYSFAFDAKSSKKETASTGNIKLDGVVEHRNRFKANYSLVVAPGFQDGALANRCQEQKVTPIKGHDLGRLLEYTVEYGAISVVKLRELFSIYDPEAVTTWVTDLEQHLKESRKLTIDVFIQALDLLKGDIPDVLSASTIALYCRKDLKVHSVKDQDVKTLVAGLQILVPDLIGIADDKIVVNASSTHVAQAVMAQLEKLKKDETDL